METLSKSQDSILDANEQKALLSKIETLETKTREMDESIRYAGLLQQSILPNDLIFKNNFFCD